MEELKPCPFCGCYPILLQDASDWKVECIGEGCECLPSTWFWDTKEDAIKAWNRRAPVPLLERNDKYECSIQHGLHGSNETVS